MKKIILLLCLIWLYVPMPMVLAKSCFIAKTTGNIIQQEGDCNKRYSPCSTFKIALSLIGFDARILVNDSHPVWPFKEGYSAFLDVWKQDQTPASWMKNSCVWYSQVLTKKLGMKQLQAYITNFDYGNKDLSGDIGKNNGMTNAWLGSSLEISGMEQILFLEKLLGNKLPVSKIAYKMTKNILFVQELSDGWQLYGKTGNGLFLSVDKTTKTDIQHGWFIGWIEKNGKIIVFSNHIVDDEKQNTFASQRAKADAKERLIKIIYDIR